MSSEALAATQVLTWIGELYGVERHGKREKLDAPALLELRQKRARPVLAKLHAYLRRS